ncbi:MAG: histidine kinase [Bacteroidetes bacterium]|nr:histidine kinase [Bacteroidota bacterium]
MKNNTTKYLVCQFSGWLFYGLSLVFFAFIFDHKISSIYTQRLILSIVLGMIFTHLLRYALKKQQLLPPLSGNQWITFFIAVILTCAAYSFINSSLVEILKWYDPKMKASIDQRFVFNIFNDSPIIFVWVSIYYLWHYIEAERKTKFDQVRLESLVKELQLKTIKSHINPHFIFNALNSIRALVDENPERARTAITELSNILRSSMKADSLETVSLERELRIVKDYLELEHIRFEDRLKVAYYIDDETLDQPIPPMMLQTLVENAIKHGISREMEGGKIKIFSTFKDHSYEMAVQNTGHFEPGNDTDGFGISSTQNRLKLIYGNQALFEIKNIEPHLVEAKISIPILT